MRTGFFLIALLFSGFVVQAEMPAGLTDSSAASNIIIKQSPAYPGGEEARIKFLRTNAKYPPHAMEKGISGTVYVQFVVSTTGKIIDVKVLRGIGGGCDEEAVRLVSMMPDWTPGTQNGRAVLVQFNMPVGFHYKDGMPETLTNKNPEANAFYEEGTALYRKADFNKAIDAYNKCLELTPDDIYALYNRGAAKLRMGDKQGARADWKMAKSLGWDSSIDNSLNLCND